MTPLADMQDAVKAGSTDPIARAVVAVAAIRLADLQAASDDALERLLLELRATVASADMVLRERERIRQRQIVTDGCRLNQPTGEAAS